MELSTEEGTLAWVEDGVVRLERTWPGEGRQRRPVFADLHAAIAEGTLDWSRIDRLAVGTGPGAFTGLRVAVSLMQGLSLPDGRPLTAVSSARALAHAVLKETGASRVVVLGDARRQELWAGCFESENGIATLRGDWVVAAAGQLPEFLKAKGSIWVTPDWDRIGPALEAGCGTEVRLLREIRRPGAGMVAELVRELVERGLEGEQAEPVYVHPAVAVAPRF